MQTPNRRTFAEHSGILAYFIKETICRIDFDFVAISSANKASITALFANFEFG